MHKGSESRHGKIARSGTLTRVSILGLMEEEHNRLSRTAWDERALNDPSN